MCKFIGEKINNLLIKRNTLKNELESISIYIEEIKNNAAKKRIKDLFNWYIRKAVFYKRVYYILSFLLIAINAVIPVLISIDFEQREITIAILSFIATVITGSLTLFTVKETWLRYREHVEMMKSECIKFSQGIGEYKDKEESKLIENIEKIVQNERDTWKSTKFSEN